MSPLTERAELKVHALHCGGDVEDIAVFDPFDPKVGTKVYSPYFIYVIEHPEGNVLFDTGCHPDLRSNPEARLGPMAEALEFHLGAADDVVGQLARIGLTPEDISIVVQSHLHFDHAGGLEFLTHAPVYIRTRELEFASEPPAYQEAAYVRADFDHELNWHELPPGREHDLFEDGRVVLIPTPGHTPGHQSLLVRLQQQPVLLLSDATYSLEKMRDRALPAIVWSPDAMLESWLRLEQLESEENALLICTHELAFKERIRLAPEACYR